MLNLRNNPYNYSPNLSIMKKIYTLVFLLACVFFGHEAFAQNPLPKYQRSSLHMILLTTDEPALAGESEDFTTNINEAWQSYSFPDKYDQHKIDFVTGYGGKPKGTINELITRFQTGLSGLSIKELKELSQNLSGTKEYNAFLTDTTQIMLREQKVGQMLISKWFNITADGSFSGELIKERSAYNATQANIAEAASTTRGLQAITDAGEDLIGNTFVSFSKLSFYKNEPIAAFSRDLATTIAQLDPTGYAGPAAITAANTAYEMIHLGYSAATTTILYRLVWNDSIKTVFYSTFENGKINMEKFNQIDFPFELVGLTKTTSSTFDVKGGLAKAIGLDQLKDSLVKPSNDLIQQTIIRNLDKSFADLQSKYDVFKPLIQITSVDETNKIILADMGLKESVKDNDQFEILEAVQDPKTNKLTYQSKGTLKVVKGKVWDNRYALTEEAKKEQTEEGALHGTQLSWNKNVIPGTIIRLITKKKK